MHKIVKSRAPLRLGFAGGGSDVAPYCDVYGGCVLNATIDRYAYSVIECLRQDCVQISAPDIDEKFEMRCADVLSHNHSSITLNIYQYFMDNYNSGEAMPLRITTFCDAPPGSGLGSSSTLVVAIVQCFVELLNLSWDDYQIADVAYYIERVQCNLAGGKQDQYAATFGGFNFMEFGPKDHNIIIPLRLKQRMLCEMEARTLLYFTGESRSSAEIIKSQSMVIKTDRNEALNAMHGIKNEAQVFKENLLRGDFDGMAKCISDGWLNKKKTSDLISNPKIDEIVDTALKEGADAGKVSGAGGGGFMMFFVPIEKRVHLTRVLNQFGGYVQNCHFTTKGSETWVV